MGGLVVQLPLYLEIESSGPHGLRNYSLGLSGYLLRTAQSYRMDDFFEHIVEFERQYAAGGQELQEGRETYGAVWAKQPALAQPCNALQ
jgi:hypothetical protein